MATRKTNDQTATPKAQQEKAPAATPPTPATTKDGGFVFNFNQPKGQFDAAAARAAAEAPREFPVLEKGTYIMRATRLDRKEPKNGGDDYFSITLTVASGERAGRKLWLNLFPHSPKDYPQTKVREFTEAAYHAGANFEHGVDVRELDDPKYGIVGLVFEVGVKVNEKEEDTKDPNTGVRGKKTKRENEITYVVAYQGDESDDDYEDEDDS